MSLSPHICFITLGFSRRDSLIVHRQGKSLVADGYRVSYVLCDGLPPEKKEGIEMMSIDTNFDSFSGKLFSWERHLKARYELNAKIHRLKEFLRDYEADIFQINDFELLSLGLFLKRKGKKVVYNLREYYPVYYSRRRNNRIIQSLWCKSMERKLTKVSRKYDAIFSCMPEMHDYIRKVMPCRYFEDVANFPVVDKSFSLSYEEYSAREKVISYFGSIYNISCQETLLSALEDLPDVKYLLAGVFYDPAYQASLMKMEAWKQVEFINGFSREELPGIIARSIVGNVVKDFNKTETPQGSFSIIKIFETMEAAVPVILAKVPLYEEMVEKYHCGICVDPYSVEDFKAAIKFIIDNPKEAYQMGQNGREAVLKEYSWDSQYVRYLATLQAILNED